MEKPWSDLAIEVPQTLADRIVLPVVGVMRAMNNNAFALIIRS
jgi:hypothetical protein